MTTTKRRPRGRPIPSVIVTVRFQTTDANTWSPLFQRAAREIAAERAQGRAQ